MANTVSNVLQDIAGTKGTVGVKNEKINLFSSRLIRDRDWIRQSFLVGSTNSNGVKSDNLDPTDVRNRSFSTVRLKFTDTSPGGNLAINAPAQFTRNADIKSKSLVQGGKGMGRYYSEAIDDNSRLISMRFGVANFNSLTTFWGSFYDADIAALARTGKRKGIAFQLGQAIGYVIPLLSLPLFLSGVIGKAFDFLTMTSSSKYYQLHPTMHLYWNAVNTIFNNIAVNKGVIPRVFSDSSSRKLDNTYSFTPEDFKSMRDLIPDIMTDDGGINSYAIATKAQRNSRRMTKAIEAIIENSGDKLNLAQVIDDIQRNGLPVEKSKYNGSFVDYIGRWMTSEKDGASEVTDRSKTGGPYASTKEEMPSLREFMEAELEDGAMFATFRVDAEGSIGESFSNQTEQPAIVSQINARSSESRSTMFNLAGGNIGDGVIASAIEGIVGGAKNLIEGVGAGIGASGLAALAGAAFVDIPNVWASSTASLPRMNYTITLSSPYGNKMSQLINIYLPLSMLLAAALPLSTGKHSYTSPFLLELYDRGRAQTRLGIIDSITITRGTSNLAFDNNGNAMAIEVSFSVIDLSSVLHMPINRGFSLTKAAAGAVAGGVVGGPAGAALGAGLASLTDIFTDDTAFSDYMATLGSLSLHEQIYTGDRLRLNLTKQMKNMKDWASKANFANWAVDGNIGRLASIFYDGVNNR
jgi:hypothetical protein